MFREPVNGLTHLGAAIAALLGLGVLIYLGRASTIKQVTLTIYGVSLISMFTASAVYHLVKARPEILVWLRRLDHTAIYLLIAGTYTPICMYFFDGFFRWGMLAIIWSIALVGISAKLLWINAPRWISAGSYLLMGWLAIAGIRQIIVNMPAEAITWLVLGGLFYTVGAVIYIIKKPNFYPGVFGFHELWHIFVILGAVCHYILVSVFVAFPI